MTATEMLQSFFLSIVAIAIADAHVPPNPMMMPPNSYGAYAAMGAPTVIEAMVISTTDADHDIGRGCVGKTGHSQSQCSSSGQGDECFTNHNGNPFKRIEPAAFDGRDLNTITILA
jgi:hypothetical protein